MNRKGFGVLVIVLIIAIVLIVTGVVWYYETEKALVVTSIPVPTVNPSATTTPVTSPATSAQIADGTYTITSITPSSGPIGTEIVLKGNFSGLEYATAFHFENEISSQDTLIGFMPSQGTGGFSVEDTMCSQTLGGSGLPCPAGSAITITPGKYYVYFENLATNEISNKVQFTVTP